MLRAIALSVVFSILWVPAALAQVGWTGNINLFGGQRSVDFKDHWSNDIDVSKQNEFGVKIDFKQQDWPVSIAIDYLFSSDDDSASATRVFPGLDTVSVEEDVTGKTSELNLGIRKIWDLPSPIHPFIGSGISLATAKLDIDTTVTSSAGFGSISVSHSTTDTGVGVWIDGGVYGTLAEHFNIGVALAWSRATVTLFDEAGGFHYGLLAGYHW